MRHSGPDFHEWYLGWVKTNEKRDVTLVGATEVTRVWVLVKDVVARFISKIFGVDEFSGGKLVTASGHVTKTHEGDLPLGTQDGRDEESCSFCGNDS
jgi:hypothetical protein